MIHRLYSSLPSFKNLEFHPGLNIILADKSPGATDQQTRNGAGKSSVIEVMHFVTGSNVDKGSVFLCDALFSQSFGIEFDLNGVRTRVERTPSHKNEVVIVAGDTSKWPVTTQTDKTTGNRLLSCNDWKKILGNQMFGLEYNRRDTTLTSFVPTFRSMISYFVRREAQGGMHEPQKHYSKQNIWDQQVNIMFLLGLDWSLAREWEQTRRKEEMLRDLRKIAKAGGLEGIIDKSSHLRTALVVAEDRVVRLKKSLSEFNVLPGYRDQELEASKLAIEIAQLSNDNFLDSELIADIERSLKDEVAPSFNHLEAMYAEVGITMPENVKRRFEEVREFHSSLIANRRNYLAQELVDARNRISRRDTELNQSSRRQSEIMSLLKTHGALDQYNKLQSELSKHEAYAESVRQRFHAAEELESKRNELEIRRAHLKGRLTQELAERKENVDRAVLTFEGLSSSLYEKAGSLTIESTSNGPVFEIAIQGQRSKGIGNMQIFCFDMTLMMMSILRGTGSGFLVHDSHLFDGVDGRQTATALRTAAAKAHELGFQYIVTMNSDYAESSLSKEFIEDHVVLPRLTDATEDGGLFGIRF